MGFEEFGIISKKNQEAISTVNVLEAIYASNSITTGLTTKLNACKRK